jgi:hypothetical protein
MDHGEKQKTRTQGRCRGGWMSNGFMAIILQEAMEEHAEQGQRVYVD